MLAPDFMDSIFGRSGYRRLFIAIGPPKLWTESGTYREFAKRASISEVEGVPKANDMIRHLVKAQEATARTACKLFGIVNEANDQPTGRLNATWARAWSSIGPRGQRQASSPALTLGFTLATLAITLCLKLIFASLNSHFESMEQVRHYRDVHDFPRGRWCRRQIGV